MNVKSLIIGLFLTCESIFIYSHASIAYGETINISNKISPIETNTVYGLNLEGDYNFGSLRMEGEFCYKNTDIKKNTFKKVSDTDVSIMSYMLNSYYNIQNKTSIEPIKPYIGVGLGLINANIDSATSGDNSVLGYQIIVGTGYEIDKNITLDFSYRFHRTAQDFKVEGKDIPFINSNVFAGLRCLF